MKPQNWPEFVKQLLIAHEYAEALAKEEPQHPQLPQYRELTDLVQNLAGKLTDLVPENAKSNVAGTPFVPSRSTGDKQSQQVARVVCKFPDGSSQVVPMPEGAYVQLANPPGLGRKGRGRAKRGGGNQPNNQGNHDGQQNQTEQSRGRGRGYRGGHQNGGRPSGASFSTHTRADQPNNCDQTTEHSSNQTSSQQVSNY